jgi:hypothetical protein
MPLFVADTKIHARDESSVPAEILERDCALRVG